MRWSSTTLAVAAGIPGVNAINMVKREAGSAPLVVEHTIQRRQMGNPVQHDGRRRRKRADGTVGVRLDNEETLYFMNATLGTPAQSFRLYLDTGSSDLWVNVAHSALCADGRNGCAVSGTYDANASSTYRFINSDFRIAYVDGSGSAGDYAADTVAFGGVRIERQQFGIGYTSSSAEGVLGIGYARNEVAAHGGGGGGAYPNVPQSLLDAGHIGTNAYSLWLNDRDASTGSILFGGVNADKYTGRLETLPVVAQRGGYAEFVVALTAVGHNGQVGSIARHRAIPALLDSGSALTYLPHDIAQAIYTAVGARWSAGDGVAFVDCRVGESDETIDFTFSAPTIRVALNELVVAAGVDARGRDVCIVGIRPAGDTVPVLGDTFLRSAYVVYDLSANEISLAQTNFDVTASSSSSDDDDDGNVWEITNSTGVPFATAVPNPVTSVAVPSGGARIGDGGSGATTVTVGARAAPTAAPGWNLAAAVGGAAVAGAIWAVFTS